MWISTASESPYVVSTQIRPADNDTSVISMIDTVIATTGDLFFDANKTLGYIQREDRTIIPAEQSPSRKLLRELAMGISTCGRMRMLQTESYGAQHANVLKEVRTRARVERRCQKVGALRAMICDDM